MKRLDIHPLAILLGVVCFLLGSNLAIFWSHELFRLVFDEKPPEPSTERRPPAADDPPPDPTYDPSTRPKPPAAERVPEHDDGRAAAPIYRDLPDECGSMRAVHHGRTETLAPKRADYDVDIRGDLAGVTVEQTFANPTDATISAVYQFPLNRKAAVHAMTMEVGERTIRADIKRKAEARRTYERAKRQGKNAALLSQKRPNWFTQRVANIEPDQTVEVTLRYVHALPVQEGAHQLVLPMQLGTRYGSGAGRANDLASGDLQDEHLPLASGWLSDRLRESRSSRASVDIRIDAPMPVEAVESSSHALQMRRYNESDLQLDLADPTGAGDEHFRLRFELAGEEPRAGINAFWNEETSKGYFSLLLEPPRAPEPDTVADRELVFVLDTSGSMRDRRLRAAKRFVKRALGQLRPARDAFRIVRFSNNATGFSDHPVPASEGNVATAIEYVDELRASGGTHYRPGIERALDPESPDGTLRMVVFLTDGLIGYEHQVLGLVNRKIGEARLYGIGVGGSANRYLLEEMGRMGRGFARFLETGESLETQIDRTVRRIRSPVMTDVRVDWGSLRVDDVTPAPIPDLFDGETVRVHGTYENPGTHTVTVEGEVGGERVSMPLEVTFPETESDGRAVELTWARRRIAEKMHRLDGGPEDPDAVREQIVDLGLEYSLVTEWTSFVAVDDAGDVSATERGRRESRRGPARRHRRAVKNKQIGGSLGNTIGSNTASSGAGSLGLKGAGRGGGGGAAFGRVGGLGKVGASGTGAKKVKKPSKPPKVVANKPTIQGSLDKTIIRKVVRRHRHAIKYCYEKQLQSNPKLEGKVVMQFVIAPDGNVEKALVTQSTLNDTAVESCMKRVIKRWSFPSWKGGGTVRVNYPWTFSR